MNRFCVWSLKSTISVFNLSCIKILKSLEQQIIFKAPYALKRKFSFIIITAESNKGDQMNDKLFAKKRYENQLKPEPRPQF